LDGIETLHSAPFLEGNSQLVSTAAVSYCGEAILWIRKLRNDPQDRTAARFVNVLTVYFSLFLLGYCVRQLTPQGFSIMNSLGPMTGAWLPLGCGFALVPKNGRPE
jgi:hypothetical protein